MVHTDGFVGTDGKMEVSLSSFSWRTGPSIRSNV